MRSDVEKLIIRKIEIPKGSDDRMVVIFATSVVEKNVQDVWNYLRRRYRCPPLSITKKSVSEGDSI
jgi:hypothetical protein